MHFWGGCLGLPLFRGLKSLQEWLGSVDRWLAIGVNILIGVNTQVVNITDNLPQLVSSQGIRSSMTAFISRATRLSMCCFLAVVVLASGIVSAQATKDNEEKPTAERRATLTKDPTKEAAKGKGSLSSPFGFGMPAPSGGADTKQATFEAAYELESEGKLGRVSVTADIAPGWHMYSTTQPEGGPMATKLKLLSETVNLTGPFIPDHAPDIGSDKAWPSLPIEEHHDVVSWTAPFTVAQELNPAQDTLQVAIDGQVCMTGGSCIPISEKLTAKFKGRYGETPRSESLRITGTQATWTASIAPAQVKPGELAVISLTADTDEGYHVYPFVEEDTDYRTVIVATSKAGLRFGRPQTKAATEVDNRLDTPITYHNGDVTWQIPIRVPASAQAGEYPLELQVGFMTCNEGSCSARSGLSVAGKLTVTSAPPAQVSAEPMTFAPVDYVDVVDRPSLTDWIDQSTTGNSVRSRATGAGLDIWMVLAALAGGFILNFMPCVLPVIGLKLMSFANQAGSSRAKVVSLNVSFVGGILAVMLVLALANVFAKLAGEAFGWGQQFTRLEFQVPMTVLIFAMALSFLGVWEIPIPGFATSNKSGKLMEQEGLTGAFFKGILTTLLATPCSGPFLGTLFGLTLTLSVTSIILLYVLVGIGLGLPYIALCFYPGVIKLLPKPGAWMDTLKQVLAFPLLLTVVFFVTMITPDYRIATLTLLIVVWFACWLIGRVPAYAEAYRLRSAWLAGTALTVVGAIGAFTYLGPVTQHLPWIPYSEATLVTQRAAGKTVMIEFTGRHCATCQTNMIFAINRPKIARLVDENGVVPLLADYSDGSPEIKDKLVELDSISIPLLAIYPADPSVPPIILRDSITESQLIEALKEAGPSQPESKLTTYTH